MYVCTYIDVYLSVIVCNYPCTHMYKCRVSAASCQKKNCPTNKLSTWHRKHLMRQSAVLKAPNGAHSPIATNGNSKMST